MNATTRNPSIPKLPPLPRKGNRTIYLANDELWEKAKALAGREGLSAVIARALADFVATRTKANEEFEKFHFEIVGIPEPGEPGGPTEVIGFEGKKLVSTSSDLECNPFDESDSHVETVIQIYRTRLGTFVVLATPATDAPESESAFAIYETHRSVTEVMGGHIVGCMFPPDRHELLKELTVKLGKDSVTWID